MNPITRMIFECMVEALVEDFCTEENQDYTRVGHLVWYASQGHGVGFFNYAGDAAQALDKVLSDNWRYWHLDSPYIGEDGNMYI